MNATYHADKVYLAGLRDVLNNGIHRTDRTGTGTISKFGMQNKYDLTKGFPLLTTKKIYTRGVIGELLWFLRGETNINWLRENRIKIWDEWADDNGNLGPVYSAQWRAFNGQLAPGDNPKGLYINGIDQIQKLLVNLKNDPFSRRHIINAWNPQQVDDMALPPCHTMYQFYVTPDANGQPYGLSCQLYQRSGDKFLGEPFNIASYAILTQLIAEILELKPLEFVHTFGDAHIYSNHIEQVQEQLSRENVLYPMPTLEINHPVEIAKIDINDPHIFDNYTIEDFNIVNYQSHPAIKAPIAV